MAISITVDSHVDEVLASLKSANLSILEAAGMTIQGAAAANSPVRTGALRSSFTYEVEGDSVTIGVPMDALEGNYAKYVEAGTTKMAPHHMLTNAVNENIGKFQSLAVTEYKNA